MEVFKVYGLAEFINRHKAVNTRHAYYLYRSLICYKANAGEQYYFVCLPQYVVQVGVMLC